jgi:hypothetical protein
VSATKPQFYREGAQGPWGLPTSLSLLVKELPGVGLEPGPLEMPGMGALAPPPSLPGDVFWNPGPLPISPVLAAPQALTKHPAIWFPLAGLGGGSLLPGFSGIASLEEGGTPLPNHLGRKG